MEDDGRAERKRTCVDPEAALVVRLVGAGFTYRDVAETLTLSQMEAFAREIDIVEFYQMRSRITVQRSAWLNEDAAKKFDGQLEAIERFVLAETPAERKAASGAIEEHGSGGVRIGDLALALGGIDITGELPPEWKGRKSLATPKRPSDPPPS
jgi:hypothetical protein